MLKVAYKRAEKIPGLEFSEGSLQDFSVAEEADVITALFHVMSYQTTKPMIEQAFSNIAKNLKRDGVFIFDCWYGPAVLYQRPEVRVKRMENETLRITRIAEPVMRENENIVEVHFDTFAENVNGDTIRNIKEVHEMRYFFKDELCRYAKAAGFEMVASFEFMTGKPLGKDTWGSCFVARKCGF